MPELYIVTHEVEDVGIDLYPLFLPRSPTLEKAIELVAEEFALDREDVALIEDAAQRGLAAVQGPFEIRTSAAAATKAGPGAVEVLDALARVNAHRRRASQPSLDPSTAGWTPQDVLDEAARLGPRPNLKQSLMPPR